MASDTAIYDGAMPFKTVALVMRQEGFDKKAKRDRTQDTIGFGTVATDEEVENGFEISVEEATRRLIVELFVARDLLQKHRGFIFGDLSRPRQAVLVSMTFNMGIGDEGLAGFVKMWSALEDQDYSTVASEMLDSRWADQVGIRSRELAWMMEDDSYLSQELALDVLRKTYEYE